MTRRALLGAALPLLAIPAVARRAVAALEAATARELLRVGLLLASDDVGDADALSVTQGLTLGTDESARTAALFGVDVRVAERRVGARDDATRVARDLTSSGVSILVAALPANRCRSVDAIAADGRALVVTLRCTPDSPADRGCAVSSAQLSPSAATIRRARSAYARRGGAGAAPHPALALWHHTLSRFGAAQLNERFRRRFQRHMTSEAWAGWAAMKILTEAALRSRTTDARGIATYLRSRSARFDGHKGEPLVVDPRTGELRQPLYVVDVGAAHDRVITELSIAECFGSIVEGARAAPSCAAARGDR